MQELSENKKKIYNLYLKAYRQNNDKPFRTKKNFSDIQKNDSLIANLTKIESIFLKYPAFFSQNYFDAPYKIYNDEKKYYPLSFYSSQKGINSCISYLNWLRDSDPETQFEHFKNSFKFVANFCVEKGINLEDYVNYCSVSQNDCLLHLKQHKISWYLVFNIPGFYPLLYNLPKDEFQLYYGDKIDLQKIYSRYHLSTKTVKYMNTLREKIATYIKNQLQSPKESVS